MLAAHRFFARPPADRRLLLRALALHLGVAALLRVIRFGRLRRWLRAAGSLEDGARLADPAAVERVIRAVRQAAAAVPLGRTCLTEALTAYVMLNRAGVETTLRFGVAADTPRDFGAHAWLERDGVVILGECSQPFTPLLWNGEAA